ncbi:MAG: hypothetical protein Q9218_004032 [Villophora microphyllina]
MKICVLQALYGEKDPKLKDADPTQDPSFYSSGHTFENRWLKKDTAKEQIDQAINEGFDLFFNFLWGQHEDEVAGIEAVRYLESRNIPFVGMPTRESLFSPFRCTPTHLLPPGVLERSKLDFYRDAAKVGIRVPSMDRQRFPLFVKPAKRCASMSINTNSLCTNQEELERQLRWINEELAPGRDIAGYNAVDENGDPEDIVVQEYVEGQDYSCTVLELNDGHIALSPTIYCYPKETSSKGRFLHWDLKFDPELHVEVFHRKMNPELHDNLKILAIRAFKANRMEGGAWGNVDFRVPVETGEPVVMEVNPMPAVFLPPGEHEWEDLVIRECLPGGHRTLISILVATNAFQRKAHTLRTRQVAKTHDGFASNYEELVKSLSNLPTVTKWIVEKFEYHGSVLELGSGTGIFGQLVRNSNHHVLNLTGVEPSEGMRTVCSQRYPGLYDHLLANCIEDIVMTLSPVDHVVAMDSLHFLDHDAFNLVVCRLFQIAQRSITFSLVEITNSYNKAVINTGHPEMRSFNNVPEMEMFVLPATWHLVYKKQHFAWQSPHTEEKVDATFYRFERTMERVPNGPKFTEKGQRSSWRNGQVSPASNATGGPPRLFGWLQSLWRSDKR